MDETQIRAIQYEAALEYLTKKREDIVIDWNSVKFFRNLFASQS